MRTKISGEKLIDLNKQIKKSLEKRFLEDREELIEDIYQWMIDQDDVMSKDGYFLDYENIGYLRASVKKFTRRLWTDRTFKKNVNSFYNH